MSLVASNISLKKFLKLPAAQVLAETLAVVEPPPNLEQLALGAPSPLTLDDLAARVGVEALLLYRVSQRRQALPRQFVLPIAAALGVQRAEVECAAGEVLDLGFGSHVRLGSNFRALPPDRALGDALFLRPVAPTVAPAFAPA